MTKKVKLEAVRVGLALSEREWHDNYPLNLGKKAAAPIAALGVAFYQVLPCASDTVLCTLHPVRHRTKAKRNVFCMQRKSGGRLHMEFPTRVTKKPRVGVAGKSSHTELWIYSTGVLQLRKPSTLEVVIASKKKRGFTKKQEAWMKAYSDLCFGLEPMYMDDYLAGERTFEQLKAGNIRWTSDHFCEVIGNLERLP